MQTWNLIDKTQWPERGPWDSEPDKAQWTDEATGLPCLAVRAYGHWCGYVGITEGHPGFGKDYDFLNVDVHGGLTYADFCQTGEHALVCHVPEPGQSAHVYWLGFDCAHSGDKTPATNETTYRINLQYPHREGYEHYRDLAYVQAECGNLAKQLKAMQ